MNRFKKRKNKENAEKDLEELDALGYEVVKYKPWHWRVFKPDYDLAVDVWPTVNKMMSLKTYKPKIYSHLLEEVEELFQQEL